MSGFAALKASTSVAMEVQDELDMEKSIKDLQSIVSRMAFRRVDEIGQPPCALPARLWCSHANSHPPVWPLAVT